MGLYQSNILLNGLLQESEILYSAVTIILSGVGSGSFSVPSAITQFAVECWGGGAAGWGGGAGVIGYGGGGGGGYAKTTVNLSTGETIYYYNVGSGGTGISSASSPGNALKGGGDTFFSGSTPVAFAQGGGYKSPIGENNNQLGGGQSVLAPNVGDITYDGGNGAAGDTTPSKTGGGGGAAGSTGDGVFGSQSDGNRGVGAGGTATSEFGGAGGDSYPVDTELGFRWGDGSAASNFGGGGGGGASDGGSNIGYGGDGGQGLIRITYLFPLYY